MKVKNKNVITYSLEDLKTSINALKNLTNDREIIDSLDKCYDEIKYAKPSKRDNVLLINTKLENKFDDMRLRLAHNDIDGFKEDMVEVESLLIKRKGATNSMKNENKVSLFRKIFPKKKKLSKLERSEVTDQILALEKKQSDLVLKIEGTDALSHELFEKGKKEKNLQMRTFYAKRIESINREKEANIKRATLLNYKLGLLNRLKDAIDDRDFFYDADKTDLMGLLDNDKELTKFLSSIHAKAENVEEHMINIEAKFDDFDLMKMDNETIYGSRQSTDDILAQMEMQSQLDDEDRLYHTGLTDRDIRNKEEV